MFTAKSGVSLTHMGINVYFSVKKEKKYAKLEMNKTEGSGLITGDCSVNHVLRTTALFCAFDK